MKRSQKRSGLRLGPLLAGGLFVLLPQTGEAQPVEPTLVSAQVTCFGTSRFSYTPALDGTPRDVSVTFSSMYSGCLAVMVQGVSSVSVSASSRVFPGVTCTEVTSSAPEQLTLVWNNGSTSVVTLSLAEVDAEELTTTVTFTGTVSEGRFKGMHVARSSTYNNTDLGPRCLSETGLADANVFSILVLSQVSR